MAKNAQINEVLEVVEEPTTVERTPDTIDVEALLEAQAKKFEERINAQTKANEEQIKALLEKNEELATELNNLKTNTAEENELLGEKIAAIREGKKDLPDYNPFEEKILYEVANEVAGIVTIMTGDEVQGIIGSIDTHLQKKLINGEKEIEKYPYKIKLIEDKQAKKV